MSVRLSDAWLRKHRPDLLPQAKGQKRRRAAHVPGVMNKTESRFAELLEARRLLGEIKGWAFEAETLPLGPEMTFCPDFRVEELDGSISFVDVKGAHVWEDSVIKGKTAATLYPQYAFYQAKWVKGDWKIRRFKSGAET
jgi:hypothetical protein